MERKNVSRTPQLKPPFTLGDVKKAIPPHCFERPVLRSFSFLLFDVVMLCSLFCIFAKFIITEQSRFYFLVYMVMYSQLQGCVFSRFWIIGHECGHNAFSDYRWLNDTVGFIVHSFLLFPYFSWKYNHRRHHSRTGHLHKEEFNGPMLKSEVPLIFKHLITNPATRFLVTFIVLAFGVPLYLLVNFRGRAYDRFASQFDPYSPMFSRNQRAQVFVSDAAFLTMVYALYKLVSLKGFAWVACAYGGPYLVQTSNVFLVAILQHTHPFVPFYDSSEWDWLRGSLGTIDRDFGILNTMHYQSTNTHVAHHLFPTIPHYHAKEATEAIKPILGEYYRYDDTPIYKALWTTFKECVYVEEDEGDQNKGIYWYKYKF
ncbi:delta(12)-fatty-acid desaturase FAD2-like [Daucus carota subsp. sativus]|uniref:delta(12)-fatty-acid desaturase FAD2-like n=1 Tax=Daucus carota subsp. sativus TaxID=79200 RepID=UPI0007EFE0E5|nr:PREDICTED: delta(12)-fatty-acid desaturase FAD2-like [Daucus carota subsp. sativus]